MKTSLLKLLRSGSLFTILWLIALQAQAGLQPQELPSPVLTPVRMDSLEMIDQSPAPITTGSSNAVILYNLVQELRTLPVEKEYGYYLQVLEERGYLVLGNYNDHRHWEFALEKMQQKLRLTIAYNAGTRTSTMLTASGPRVVDHDQYSQEQ